MYGIGVDIITVSRIEKSLENSGFIDMVYGKYEKEAFCTGTFKVQSLAANYGAKEAFSKALGTGVRHFALNEVEILRDEWGKPYFYFTGRAKKIVEEKRLTFNLSLSHEGGKAIAFVTAEQSKDGL